MISLFIGGGGVGGDCTGTAATTTGGVSVITSTDEIDDVTETEEEDEDDVTGAGFATGTGGRGVAILASATFFWFATTAPPKEQN